MSVNKREVFNVDGIPSQVQIEVRECEGIDGARVVEFGVREYYDHGNEIITDLEADEAIALGRSLVEAGARAKSKDPKDPLSENYVSGYEVYT